MADQAFGDSREAFAHGNTAYAAGIRAALSKQLNDAAAKTAKSALADKLNLAAADKADPASDTRTAGNWEGKGANDLYGGFNPNRQG